VFLHYIYSSPINRVILDDLSDLESSDNVDTEEIAIHASAIRNALFDNRKEFGRPYTAGSSYDDG
jgi:hypothetical protein